MKITLVLTKAGNKVLSVSDVKAIIKNSEGKGSDANKAKGHPLQHVQETTVYRKTAYAEKRNWNDNEGRGSHTCFKTEDQQAEVVTDALCSNEGKTALRLLNSGQLQAKIKTTIGANEDVVSQGNVFGFGIYFDNVKAKGIVVDIHRSGNDLHIRSAYPYA